VEQKPFLTVRLLDVDLAAIPDHAVPEWHDSDIWTPMGLWDPVCHHDPCGERLICEPMLEALQSVRHVDELHHAVLANPNNVKSLTRRRRRERRQMAAE
jgi:hypothetical protein